jgi:ribosomal protein S18 acetylase RimI-like enzyme
MPDHPEKTEIRRARLRDVPAIAELSGQLGYPASPREMAERLTRLLRRPQDSVVLVGESAREVVGWLHISVVPLLEVPLLAEINGFIVAEGYRSLGAGAKLLDAAERWARRKGCKTISVRSNVIRQRAHAFYSGHGFEHYKTQKAFRKDL